MEKWNIGFSSLNHYTILQFSEGVSVGVLWTFGQQFQNPIIPLFQYKNTLPIKKYSKTKDNTFPATLNGEFLKSNALI